MIWILINFSADTFFSDNSIAQSALNSILFMAEKEIGFKTDDCKLLNWSNFF